MYRARDAAVNSLGIIIVITWALGVSVWLSDRTMCDFWLEIGKTYAYFLPKLVIKPKKHPKKNDNKTKTEKIKKQTNK